MWTVQDEWQHRDAGDGVKRSTQAAFSSRFDNAGRLLWTNGWDPSQHNKGLKIFPSWRQDCPLPPPINRSKFHVRSKKKIECKVDKKSSFLPCFSSFSAFSFSATPLAATNLATVPPPQPSSQPDTPTTLRGVCTTSPSLSLLCKKIFPLRHRDSNSSSDHPFQRFLPIPAAVEAATLSSSAPTASDRSTVRDSSNTCNSATATLAAQLSTVSTACTTSFWAGFSPALKK